MQYNDFLSSRFTLLLLFVSLLFAFFAPTVNAANVAPWQAQTPIKAAFSIADGQAVKCEYEAVERIAARNNPAYFIICDPMSPDDRIAVLCLAPFALRPGNCVDIEGTMGTLSSSERCSIYQQNLSKKSETAS